MSLSKVSPHGTEHSVRGQGSVEPGPFDPVTDAVIIRLPRLPQIPGSGASVSDVICIPESPRGGLAGPDIRVSSAFKSS